MAVFVLDKRKTPLMPCSEKRARQLLVRGRAVVHKVRPFTIRLKDRLAADSTFQPLQTKIDPGSKITGLAVVREDEQQPERQVVLCLFELIHRGFQIKQALEQRRAFRRRRRNQLRYRAARFDNRTKPKGWLAPSLQHRVDTTVDWVQRIIKLTPITSIQQELVRFDTQRLDNPEISGVEYQQGTLLGYEVREYLLEKWGRACAYCGTQDVPLQIEHIHPKSQGGSNRISNLTLACHQCNQAKNNQPIAVFFEQDKGLKRRLKKQGLSAEKQLGRVLKQCKKPLKDAAAVNATRWALLNALKQIDLPVLTGTGGQTKFNRQRLGIPKTHALDAVCVGQIEQIEGWQRPTLTIKASGRGCYQRTRLDRFGFPRGYLMRQKSVQGFQTGDLVKAEVPSGKKAGIHTGRVAIRKTGSFNIQLPDQIIQGISWKYCRMLQRGDGYGYHQTSTVLRT
ncbi:RNA-guided endonuclease IscB [Marinospirillum sp. MEB164]|uniref:RNA-guided endonuclease IscB n=1 Tax=Marinospirillum alkalitolerans TaxID=3123374 RepID=A0ABW8PW71_9GAMM